MDRDLHEVKESAGRISSTGVRRLVDALQSYRDAARSAAAQIDVVHTAYGDCTNIDQLLAALGQCAIVAGDLESKADKDHISLAELIHV